MYTLTQQMGDTAGMVVRQLLAQFFKRLHKRATYHRCVANASGAPSIQDPDVHFPDVRLAVQCRLSLL